jgi:protein-tyrosine phosphatase
MLKQLTPTLWQSDMIDARRICESTNEWKQLGIKGVICPAYNVRIQYNPELAALILPVWDDSTVPDEWFNMAVGFHKRFSPTLVHCFGGINRSSTFALALMLKEGIPLEEGYHKVTAKPWGIPLLDSVIRWSRNK